MDLQEIIRTINPMDLFGIIFKFVSILFAIFYMGYVVLYYQQVRKLTRSYSSSGNTAMFSFATLQIVVGIILLLYAIVFL